MIYYKILRSDYSSSNISKFHIGLNSFQNNVFTYVTDIKNIFAYLSYGTIIAVCGIPHDAILQYAPEKMYLYGEEIPGWKTNKLNVKRFIVLKSAESIMDLISNGADVSVDNYALFRYALYNNKRLWNKLTVVYPNIIIEHYDEFSE